MTLQEAAIQFQNKPKNWISMRKTVFWSAGIHCKQQSLDELDYMIEKIRKEDVL